MSELSLAAQTVLDAYYCEKPLVGSKRVAAALRAAAYQVLPEMVNAVGDEHDNARREQWIRIRRRFLAIAAELEGRDG
jgi:hypothetical protein